jgi:small subunit ribosomal protein S6
MNTYELTIVIPEGENVERIVKMVTAFAKKAKGEVNKQESWGSKHLAYPIRKLAVADYEHFVISLESSAQVELDKSLRMDESILRYMFVRV